MRANYENVGNTVIPTLFASDHPHLTIKITVKSGQDLDQGAVVGTDNANPFDPAAEFVLSEAAAGDGSEVPVFVVREAVDATAGATEVIAIKSGHLLGSSLVLGAGHTVATISDALHRRGIMID